MRLTYPLRLVATSPANSQLSSCLHLLPPVRPLPISIPSPLMSSSSSSGVKQAHRVARYNPLLQRQAAAAAAAAAGTAVAEAESAEAPQDEAPADWAAMASLLLGIIGLMMRYKIAAWLSLFACLSSVCTMRRGQMDLKQVLCSLLFSVMSLVMNYFGVPKGTAAGGINQSFAEQGFSALF